MKVFVGTMEYGESDFSFCKESISNQKNVDITHYIVSNMPEKRHMKSFFLHGMTLKIKLSNP